MLDHKHMGNQVFSPSQNITFRKNKAGLGIVGIYSLFVSTNGCPAVRAQTQQLHAILLNKQC